MGMDRATFKTICFGVLGALFLLAPQAFHELYDIACRSCGGSYRTARFT